MAAFFTFPFTGGVSATIQSVDSNWTKHPSETSGNIVCNGAGRGRGSNSTPGTYYYNSAPPSANYVVRIDAVGSADVKTVDRIYILGRWHSTNFTGYGMVLRTVDSFVQLVRWDGYSSAVALAANYSFTFANSTVYDDFELVMNGDQISVKYGGATIIGPVTDATYSAAGFVGLRTNPSAGGQATSAGLHFDNFEAEEILSSGIPKTTRGLLLGVG